MGTLSSLGVLNWSFASIPHICTSAAPNEFTCPYSRTHFNRSLIWAAIGLRRHFAENKYDALLYFFLIGAVFAIAVYFLSRRRRRSSDKPQSGDGDGGGCENGPRRKRNIWNSVHVPLFLGGLNYLPPATGMNYGSWVAVEWVIFGWVIKRHAQGWWVKYNFVLSAALDSSVGVAGVVIFLTVCFTGAAEWWGTEVYKNTCDWKGCVSWTA
ncbi:hypothetical protein ASPCAL06973 [Aspergillus calidoustus]|uniref:Uncharacterized protein n=1 Tax=Aspergillus calidoustus TaxID=454130 RepID=A0A0U4Z802_ASPCI|nr:hypothetical protein ASPCAL06973 [Aspergillus calidoustus]